MTDWHNEDRQAKDDLAHDAWVLANQPDKIVDAELAALTDPPLQQDLGKIITEDPAKWSQLLDDIFGDEF